MGNTNVSLLQEQHFLARVRYTITGASLGYLLVRGLAGQQHILIQSGAESGQALLVHVVVRGEAIGCPWAPRFLPTPSNYGRAGARVQWRRK